MAQLVSRAQSVWEGSLDLPLLRPSSADLFTVRDACENVLILGGIGSGKTSGPGRALRRAMMRAGAGLLVLINKPDEVEATLDDARATERMASVLCVDGRHGFNFIEHELRRHGLDGVNTVVEFLMRVLEIIRIAMPGGGRQGEAFWENALRQLLRMVVPILYAAYGTVRISDIIRFVQSAPTSSDELDSEAWQQRSFMCEAVLLAAKRPVNPLDPEAMKRIVAYFRDEFARQDVKLRSSITSTLSTSLDRFCHGRLARLFTEETSFAPELTLNGAILILNLPVLEWNEDGVIAQQIIKYAWQRVMLSRNALPPAYRDRLVGCYVDEAQAFINSFDREFLSLSRSSRCTSIFITQSIPSVISTIGGDNPKHQADALFAQFGTKVFCNNSCPETNRFAAETVGRVLHRRASFSESESTGRSGGLNRGEGSNFGTNSGVSVSPDGKGGFNTSYSSGSSSGFNESTGRNRGFTTGESVSNGFSEAMDYEIEPGEFARSLMTGGPPNGGVVSCVWFQAGRRFAVTSRPWLVASFRQ
jgi:hypothetical protein